MQFSQLGLTAPLLKALDQVGYKTPSPIQEKAIPPLLEGRDLLGCAQTGTGKTAAFALPILQMLNKKPKNGRARPIRALILTPTRELAAQIQDNFKQYGRNMHQRSVVIFGGVGQKPQVDALSRGVDILVATPGRLLDLVGQGFVKLGRLEYFVLDEADRMLDMGFIHDIRKIINLIPKERQTLFFSATMPKEIQSLADSLLSDPVKVTVTPVSSTVDIIRQEVAFTQKADKRELLIWMMKEYGINSALVFTRTKHLADRVAKFLKQSGVTAEALHGDKSQGARLAALSNFKNGKCRVLVATDIAARGIDVDGITHVFNFDLPDTPETYVHRIGRTGRAGREGISISFCAPEDLPLLTTIQRLIKKELIVIKDHPHAVDVSSEKPPADGNGRSRSASKSPRGGNRDQRKGQGAQQGQRGTEQRNRPSGNQEKRPAQKPVTKQENQPLTDNVTTQSHNLPPIPKGGFSSDMRLPGRVAAKAGHTRNTGHSNTGGTQKSSGSTGQQHQQGHKKASEMAPPAHRQNSDANSARRAGGAHQGGKRRGKKNGPREPVWVPLNNQPIVTRPQTRSAFPEVGESGRTDKGKNRG